VRRKERRLWSFDKKSFQLGISCSLIIFLCIFTLLFWGLAKYGLTIYLDSEELAKNIQEQIILFAEHEMPQIIEDVKAEIPRVVRSEMQAQLSDRMEIAGFVFTMPVELKEQLAKNMQANVEKTIGKILDCLSEHILANGFGNNVYELIRETFTGQLQGHTVQVYILGKIPLKVRLQLK